MSDKINVTVCPKCGNETKQQFPILYTNAEKKFAVWWEPVHDEQVDLESAMYKQISGNVSYLAAATRIRAWNAFKQMILSYERDYTIEESIKSQGDQKDVVSQTIWRRFLNSFQSPQRLAILPSSSATTNRSKSGTTAVIIIPGDNLQTENIFKAIGAKLNKKNSGELDPCNFSYSVQIDDKVPAQPYGKVGSAKIYRDPESAFEVLFQVLREVKADPMTKISITYNGKEEQREFRSWTQNNPCKSDDFVMPIAPPHPSCIRGEIFPEAPTSISSNPVQIPDSSFVNPNREYEQGSQRGTGESKEQSSKNSPLSTESPHARDNDTTVPEIPEITIDDHPFVAAIIIILGIFTTVLAVSAPFFLIALIPVYIIIFDFFRKKRLRMNLRNQPSRHSDNAP